MQVPLWKDGRSVDINERARLVQLIRQDLNSWDGKLSSLECLKTQIECWLRESGWPQAGAAPSTVAVVEPESRPAPLIVET